MYIALLMLLLAYFLLKEYVPRAVGRIVRIRSTDAKRPDRPVQQEYG
jgi:hypothetical protein